MKLNSLAGQLAPDDILVDVPHLLKAYYATQPDTSVAAQRVAFGTSGHRGSSLDSSFNEWHVLAITQAICLYRAQKGIAGPLFLEIDTHALSEPAAATALEVLAGNGVEVMIAEGGEYTPTPVISHAILAYNRERSGGLADGIVITPSHNPPRDGGFKYNPPHGGPAESVVTNWIQAKANDLLEAKVAAVKRISYRRALTAGTTHRRDCLSPYINDLGSVIDMDVVRGAKLRLGVDPLGGAGVHYWARIAERYDLDLTVVSETVDPTFRFMPVDWDGQIRMDPSSPNAMARLIDMKDLFDLLLACDTDHDRHGIVTPGEGLLPANHFLAVAISELFGSRPQWSAAAKIGKTVVSTALIDRLASKLNRTLYEVPVGFKWFVGGLLDSALGFVGEESAGASFLRRDGSVWTTDKDGFIPCLLGAEIMARTGSTLGDLYGKLACELGEPCYDRVDAPATSEQKAMLSKISAEQIELTELAGERITALRTAAPGNGESLGGIKVETASGWFAACPSGTEDIYKIYAESFRDEAHLRAIVEEAQAVVKATLQRKDPHESGTAETNMKS